MNRYLAGALAVALPTLVHAQSSITLFGRIDNGIEYISGITDSNHKRTSAWSMESGNWGGSYWAMRGEEDISSKTKVVFHLEGALLTNTGQGVPGVIWNRWSVVGINDERFGEVLLGRELSVSNYVAQFDPFRLGNRAAAVLMRGRSWNKSSNNISYQTPKWNGLEFYGQYSLSNATNWNGDGSTSQGRQAGAMVTYSASLFQVRAIYDEIRNPANGRLDDLFQYSREYVVATNVFLGPVKLQAAYQTAHASPTDGSPTALQHEWLGITWRPTPFVAFTAAGYHVNVNHGDGTANFYALGAAYFLSKRTQLDLQISTVRNSEGANFDIQDDLLKNSTNVRGHAQTSTYVSINHTF
jgi:predicted porin